MGLRHLICWTNDHFIKKHWNVRRETRFPRVRIFRIFENLDFCRFDPMILCRFLWRFRWKTLESHNSKQTMVYEQITFFIKNLILSKKKKLPSKSIFSITPRTQNSSSFRRLLKKSLWNHYKKSETFTNRCTLKNQYQRWA